MTRFWPYHLLAASLLGALAVGAAHAALFPDVPDGHLYNEAVESLAASQVVKGNPDGTFAPGRAVNRAEMLIMLYRATGRTADPSNRLCYPDVEPNGWYEAVVCDATAMGFVTGYADGSFKPAQSVNRVEALKMIYTVIGIPVEDITDEQRDVVKFVDVSTAAWYTKYLFSAFTDGILPIPGMQGDRFEPDRALSRGEAAAFMYNALNVIIEKDREEEPEEKPEDEAEEGDVIYVEFPFETSGKFNMKKPKAYRFDINSPVLASSIAQLQAGQPGAINCQLYLLGEEGFSDEYFLGFQKGMTCSLLNALSPGSYQLQLQPTEADTTFSVSSLEGTGDGNDGFGESVGLMMDVNTNGTIEEDDFEDWYSFSLQGEQNLTVEFASNADMRCIVYAMSDVDWYGFEGPDCNKVYNYPPGTYYVAVGRAMASTDEQAYSVRLR